MNSLLQQDLFVADPPAPPVMLKRAKLAPAKTSTSGTFSASRNEAIHRWFKYSAGFSSVWTTSLIKEKAPKLVLDPFVGSGTVCVVADMQGVPSIGIEAHPFVFRMARAKVSWTANIEQLQLAAGEMAEVARTKKHNITDMPDLLAKCYKPEVLDELLALRAAYWVTEKSLPDDIKSLLFLAISAILRPVSHVGTAQWQYILPAKTKAKPADVFEAFKAQVSVMYSDMSVAQLSSGHARSQIICSDARTLKGVEDKKVDFVITSPPYANNYDYADATRLEMTFWGEVSSWGDLHDAARKYLVRSSSQHVSKDRLNLMKLLDDEVLYPIKAELATVCFELERIKETKGGKKSYDMMLAAYFSDMARTFLALRRVVKAGGEMCWVIGDSAPYGIHAPADRWLGELALAAGFNSWSFEKLRDRNIKWKNRKHRVPLQEGRLWVKG